MQLHLLPTLLITALTAVAAPLTIPSRDSLPSRSVLSSQNTNLAARQQSSSSTNGGLLGLLGLVGGSSSSGSSADGTSSSSSECSMFFPLLSLCVSPSLVLPDFSLSFLSLSISLSSSLPLSLPLHVYYIILISVVVGYIYMLRSFLNRILMRRRFRG
jgi:hypothetical protein